MNNVYSTYFRDETDCPHDKGIDTKAYGAAKGWNEYLKAHPDADPYDSGYARSTGKCILCGANVGYEEFE